jgi:hypothetical protein
MPTITARDGTQIYYKDWGRKRILVTGGTRGRAKN